MKTTSFKNIMTLFFPLMVGVILTYLANGAGAKVCCYVGECGGKPKPCNPCRTQDYCGPLGLCGGYTCPPATEGVLSVEAVAAEARKFSQGAAQWRKAEQNLEDRKSDDIFEHGYVKELLKKDNAHEHVVEDREAENVPMKTTAHDLVKKDLVKATVEDRNIEGASKNDNADDLVKKTNDELDKKDNLDEVVKKDNAKDVIEDREVKDAMAQANVNDPYAKRNVGGDDGNANIKA